MAVPERRVANPAGDSETEAQLLAGRSRSSRSQALNCYPALDQPFTNHLIPERRETRLVGCGGWIHRILHNRRDLLDRPEVVMRLEGRVEAFLNHLVWEPCHQYCPLKHQVHEDGLLLAKRVSPSTKFSLRPSTKDSGIAAPQVRSRMRRGPRGSAVHLVEWCPDSPWSWPNGVDFPVTACRVRRPD